MEMVSVSVSVKKTIKHQACEENVWNPRTCACKWDKNCEIGKYLKDCQCMKNLGHDLVVTCVEIVNTPKKSPIIGHDLVVTCDETVNTPKKSPIIGHDLVVTCDGVVNTTKKSPIIGHDLVVTCDEVVNAPTKSPINLVIK